MTLIGLFAEQFSAPFVDVAVVEWTRAALVTALASAGAVVVVAAYLGSVTGKSVFKWWTGGWGFYAIHLVMQLGLLQAHGERLLQTAWLASGGISLLFFLLGTWQGIRSSLEKWVLYGGTLLVMAACYAGVFLWSQPRWVHAIEFALLGVVAFRTARLHWQPERRTALLLAIGYMGWGAVLLVLPLLGTWPTFANVALVGSTLPTVAVAMGMMLTEEREASERRYRDVLDAAEIGIFVVDLRTLQILDANRLAQRLVKYTHAELTQMRMPDLCPDLQHTKDNVVDHRAMLGALFKPLNEVPVVRKDEAIILCEGDTHVIQWRRRAALQINFREVEPEKSVRQALRRAEKMSSLGQLVAGVAHELNNPLAVVVAYAQLMAKQEHTDAKTQGMLQKVVHESERAAKIVRDLLSFARPCVPQMKVVDVNRLVAQVLEVREADFRAQNVQCEMRLASDLPLTKADPMQIEQVLTNLVTNALHAMSEQTTERRITVTTETTGFHIRVTVADTGPGIPPSIMDKIFDPFFTTKPAGKGTGLGLSICNAIMQEHRGKIWAQSDPGHGAKFFVELLIVPCEEEEAVSSAPSPLAASGADDRKPRILVVDDEDGIREVLTDILVSNGYDVDSVGNGKEALDLIRSKPYDLVVSDVGMPGMDGEGLYRHVAEEQPMLAHRIVFLTGDTLNPKTRAFVEGTGNPWIGKPFNIAEIENTIREIVRPDLLRALTETTANRYPRRYRSTVR